MFALKHNNNNNNKSKIIHLTKEYQNGQTKTQHIDKILINKTIPTKHRTCNKNI